MISFFSEKGLKVEEVVGSMHNSYFLCEGGELFGAGQAKGGNLGILSSKQIQRLLSLSLEMLKGFSQVLKQTTPSLQSLMGVFGLLEEQL